MYYVSPYYRMPDYFCNNPLLFSFVVTYAVLVNNEREDSESDIVNLIPQFVPSTLILPLLVILKIVGNCRDVDTTLSLSRVAASITHHLYWFLHFVRYFH